MGLPAALAKTDTGATLPAHLKNGTGLGNENMTADDQQIPRLKLLQKMSPEVDEDHEKYVDGAKAGMFLNTITHELVDETYVINLYYQRAYTVFKKLEAGGGFFGNFPTEAEARDAIEAEGEAVKDFDIKENHIHTLLTINPETAKIDQPVLMDMTGTKVFTSKRWNTEIANKGGDRFSAIWKLSSRLVSKNNNKWHSMDIDFALWAPKDVYEAARANYETMKAAG